MQLDKTEIVIRQRTTLELLDLSLLVIRRYWWELATSSALLSLPLLALNVWLVAWMLGEQGQFAMVDVESPDSAVQNRYLLHMFALWYLEFPLASLPATVLIGNQIFFERLSFRRLLAELRPMAFRALFVLGIVRMGLVALPLEFMIDREDVFNPVIEVVFLLLICCGWATFRRATSPFAPEILGLESCKLRTRKKNELSYWRRARSLHSPIIGECMGRFFTCATVVSLLVAMLYSLIFVGDFVGLRRGKMDLLNSVLSNRGLIQIVLPLALWLAGIFATVFRFLSYLDSRIRLEGWEVELQLKAERARVLQSMSTVPEEQLGEVTAS